MPETHGGTAAAAAGSYRSLLRRYVDDTERRALIDRLVCAGDIQLIQVDDVMLLVLTEQGRTRLTEQGRRAPRRGATQADQPAGETGAGVTGDDPVAAYHQRAQQLHDERNRLRGEQDLACRICGCTQDDACVTAEGPCRWVYLPGEQPICSACEEARG